MLAVFFSTFLAEEESYHVGQESVEKEMSERFEETNMFP